ncbi:unnamed protein product, partial [Effrenium voratum]
SLWQLGLCTLCQSLSQRLQPDHLLLNAQIGACERAQGWSQSLATLERLEEDHGWWVFQLAVPDIASYGTALSACSKRRSWAQALRLLSCAE